MRCMVCKVGDTARGTVSVTLQRGNTVVIVRDAPAAVCQSCGEYYLDKATAGRLFRQGALPTSSTGPTGQLEKLPTAPQAQQQQKKWTFDML
jgi:YgiT-type zinc finger domain-containing protein